ncbi:MAG: hypothetical protein ACFBSC_12140 [Microcoleaceae cyanobacterium]
MNYQRSKPVIFSLTIASVTFGALQAFTLPSVASNQFSKSTEEFYGESSNLISISHLLNPEVRTEPVADPRDKGGNRWWRR